MLIFTSYFGILGEFDGVANPTNLKLVIDIFMTASSADVWWRADDEFEENLRLFTEIMNSQSLLLFSHLDKEARKCKFISSCITF